MISKVFVQNFTNEKRYGIICTIFLKNVVYLELLRRGYETNIGKVRNAEGKSLKENMQYILGISIIVCSRRILTCIAYLNRDKRKK